MKKAVASSTPDPAGHASGGHRVRVLHVVSALDGGGVERMLMEYSTAVEAEGLEFHYAVHGDKVGRLEGTAIANGSTVRHITPRKVSVLRNWFDTLEFVRDGDFDVVHSHLNFSNVTAIWAARVAGIPVRIAHAHGGFAAASLVERVRFAVSRQLILWGCTSAFACSEAAGTWLFGKKWRGRKRAFLMKNAMNLKQFAYDERRRTASRLEEGAGNDRVVLCVGRLSPEKNHMFMVEVLDRLPGKGEGYQLWIAGDGPLRTTLREEIEIRGLSCRIRLLGHRTDVARLMQAADVLAMPSESEGLGLALIEAQAAALPCLASTGVSREVDCTGLIQYLPIDAPQDWVRTLTQLSDLPRESRTAELAEAGYEITSAASRYVDAMRALIPPRHL